jgi:hypothetical protein
MKDVSLLKIFILFNPSSRAGIALYRSVQVDYSQDMSIIVKSNHIDKDRRHTHGAAGGTNNSCRIANINLYSDTL